MTEPASTKIDYNEPMSQDHVERLVREVRALNWEPGGFGAFVVSWYDFDRPNFRSSQFLTELRRQTQGEAPEPQAAECECLPGEVCGPCTERGYRNGLAGYAARIYPDQVTQADMDEQDRADREAELEV